jgi:hypothetical protein
MSCPLCHQNQIKVRSMRQIPRSLSHYDGTCLQCNASLWKHDDPNREHAAWNTFEKRCNCPPESY